MGNPYDTETPCLRRLRESGASSAFEDRWHPRHVERGRYRRLHEDAGGALPGQLVVALRQFRLFAEVADPVHPALRPLPDDGRGVRHPGLFDPHRGTGSVRLGGLQDHRDRSPGDPVIRAHLRRHVVHVPPQGDRPGGVDHDQAVAIRGDPAAQGGEADVGLLSPGPDDRLRDLRSSAARARENVA